MPDQIEEQKITPWSVKGENKDGKSLNIDYDKLIKQFGCVRINEDLIKRLQSLTSIKVHPFIIRNLVFAHRDFTKILDAYENKKPFYLYTGRGPSSSSMHLGHAVPFLLTKYLQDAFDVQLVIQITDDEKFLWKEMTLKQAVFYAKENIKDIISFGFNPEKTFIFLNTEYAYKFMHNTLNIGKSISFKEATKVFGFDETYSLSQIEFPVKQIAPCFASTFNFLPPNSLCLIPAAIDQDPYFRLARDKAHIIKQAKPATIYSTFLPDLNGLNSKMSASDTNSSIFLTDDPATVKNKILKYAFSGGRHTLEEHRRLGADLEVDVPIHYLKYFLHDDVRFKEIESDYGSGKMTTSEVKNICIETLNEFLAKFQEKRRNVTEDDYKKFTFFSH